jgi:hypothetical protein
VRTQEYPDAQAARSVTIPDLRARLFLQINPEWKDTRNDSELLRKFAHNFREQWPWHSRPEVFYDPRYPVVLLDGQDVDDHPDGESTDRFLARRRSGTRMTEAPTLSEDR